VSKTLVKTKQFYLKKKCLEVKKQPLCESECLSHCSLNDTYEFTEICNKLFIYTVCLLLSSGCGYMLVLTCYASRLFQEDDDFPISDHMQDSEVQK